MGIGDHVNFFLHGKSLLSRKIDAVDRGPAARSAAVPEVPEIAHLLRLPAVDRALFAVLAHAVEDGVERLAVHAAHVACHKDGTAALSLDEDVGNECKDGEHGEQNQKAQHDVCQTLYRSVEDARAVRDELVKYDWDITKIDKICNKLGIKRSRR